MVSQLDSAELVRRAARVRLLLTDVDGCLTEGGVWYSESGEALKRFHLRDGHAVELLVERGIEVAFLTRESTGFARARAEKLGLRRSWIGVRDKRTHVEGLVREGALDPARTAYLGDDVIDLGVFELLRDDGIVAAPADAMPSVRAAAHFVTALAGGQGAFRELADFIIATHTERGIP